MSSLVVVCNSRLVMLEVAVQNLHVPRTDIFDEALLKKTVIMFRMLDDEWTTLMPNRRDYRSYRGSNYENEPFHGGRSVVFSVPETVFEDDVTGVDVQIFVYKEVSKYFELERRRNFGFTLVGVDDLLNGIIKDLRERKELEGYFSSSLAREPISRSTRGTFTLLDEDMEETEATIELYIRISYLGECIITEVYSPRSIRKAFYAREETDDRYPYQFRELTAVDVESFCWGSFTVVPPVTPDTLVCACRTEREETTQTKKRRKRRRKSDFWARLSRVRELLALLKELRKNRPEIPGLGEKPRKVCPPSPPQPCFCPLALAAPCVYTMPPNICPNTCQPATVPCLSTC